MLARFPGSVGGLYVHIHDMIYVYIQMYYTNMYSIIFLHIDSALSTKDYNAWPITYHKHKCVVNDQVPMWIEMI